MIILSSTVYQIRTLCTPFFAEALTPLDIITGYIRHFEDMLYAVHNKGLPNLFNNRST